MNLFVDNSFIVNRIVVSGLFADKSGGYIQKTRKGFKYVVLHLHLNKLIDKMGLPTLNVIEPFRLYNV